MTKRKPLFIFARAAMTLLVMLLSTATAWAESVNYKDATGNMVSVEATVLTNSTDVSNLATGWYVVKGNVSYTSCVTFNGNVNLILADNAQLNINSNDGVGIWAEGALSIYAQSTGSRQGVLSSYGGEYSIYANGVITFNGGTVNSIGGYAGNIYTTNDIVINGGSVIATNGNDGINAKGDISVNDGVVTAIGDRYGIGANDGNGTIALNGGVITAVSSGENKGLKGIVTIGSDLTYFDGTKNYTNNETSLNTLKSLKNVNVWPKVDIPYIDENGDNPTCSDYIMLTNGTDISSALGTFEHDNWYVVKGNVSYNSTLKLSGVTHLILADGCALNIGSENTPISTDYGYGIEVNGSLTIYGQNVSTGKLNVNAIGHGMSANNLTITGGCINSTTSGEYCCGIFSAGDISITNGDIIATASNEEGKCDGIYSYRNITVTGGTVNAIGDEYGIYAEYDFSINGGNITATGGEGIIDTYTILAGGTVTASSYNGIVAIANDVKYSCEGIGTLLEGKLESADLNNIKGKELTAIMPSTYELTAKPADGNYWSTFYFGSMGFTIDEGVNACAYTATYGLNSEKGEYEITLHKLGEDGKSIPEGTAVIIVSSTASVSMTPNGNLGKFSGSNDLRGVDVITRTGYITTELGGDTFFVLGMTTVNEEVHFGFHEYTGTTMAARKAFLLIDEYYNEALARGIPVVFDDDDKTGIITTNYTNFTNSDDSWYDLQGRKIQMPTQRGLYIHNGKKIVVK